MMAGLLFIYGPAIIWSVLACLSFKRRQTQMIVLCVHIAMSGVLAAWLISTDWAVGMVVIMIGPGAAIALTRLMLRLLSFRWNSNV
ncbi:hypothetical protein [Nonomuraea angiospora]